MITTLLLISSAISALAADGTITAQYASKDPGFDLNPDSAFWAKAEVGRFSKGPRGEEHDPQRPTEVRVKWTKQNLWVLYVSPYEKMYVTPNPQTSKDTNKLWDYDVVELFIGSDFENIQRYKEYEVSPQNEWVDLDIHRDDKTWDSAKALGWNSGFQSAVRVDKDKKIWYCVMRVPWKSITKEKLDKGSKFRVNFYRIEDGPENRKYFAWREVGSRSYHTPEKFGLLELVK
jgi:hypothetical protein